MMNNLDNKEILPDEILNAIDEILRVMPNAVFGGSIALNAVGLLSRRIKDIDLFCSCADSLNRNGFLDIKNNGEIYSDTVTDIEGNKIVRTGTKVLGVNVCCFKVSSELLQHSKHKLQGRELCIQNVNYAIMAKRDYQVRNEKHKSDLVQINKELNKIFGEIEL